MYILGEIPNQLVVLGINTQSIMHIRANFMINLMHYVLIMRALCILGKISLSREHPNPRPGFLGNPILKGNIDYF